MLGLNADALGSLKIPVPPLSEQRKIAEILRTWDEAIDKLTALRKAKEKRLHSLREKLTYFDAHGEPVRLGDVSEEVTKRNGGGLLGREMVMGVTNSRGIVPMREQTIAEERLIPFIPAPQDVDELVLRCVNVLVLFPSCQPVGKPTDPCPARRSTRASPMRTRARGILRNGVGRRASCAPLAAPAKAGR